ncbi:MAG: histidine phosphatase family protein [Anaerolineaceae bacterium]|nr:histidine phosphatase family protein [Anaerolineaceae bacterium]
MQLFFIRHAESQNNASWTKYQDSRARVPDPSLTELGFRQADNLASFLAGAKDEFPFTRMYISPFLRTLQTAAPLAKVYPDIPKIVRRNIHEHGGVFEIDHETGEVFEQSGMSRTEMKQMFPDFIIPEDEVSENGWWNRGIEPHAERPPRAQLALAQLMEEFVETDEVIALVSHGGFFNGIMNSILNLIRRGDYWFVTANTSISHFAYVPRGDEREWRVLYTNRFDFVPPEIRSGLD